MNMDQRIAIGQQAVAHSVPSHAMLLVCAVVWTALSLVFLHHFPTLAPAWVPLHLLCAWKLLKPGARGTLPGILLAPGLALYALFVAVRARSFTVAREHFSNPPRHDLHAALPDVRLCPAGATLDLDSCATVGSMHARMQDLAQRTPIRESYIQIVHDLHPGAILVSGARRHALVSQAGQLLGIARIPKDTP